MPTVSRLFLLLRELGIVLPSGWVMLYCPCLVSHALPAGAGCIVLPSTLEAVLFVMYCPVTCKQYCLWCTAQ
jgi:hypothetical protein